MLIKSSKSIPVQFHRSAQPKGYQINGELLEPASAHLFNSATDVLKKQFGENYDRNISVLSASLGLYR